MRRSVPLLLILALLLAVLPAPAVAQNDPDPAPDQNERIYLPNVSRNLSGTIPPADDDFADTPAVTEVSAPTVPGAAAAAAAPGAVAGSRLAQPGLGEPVRKLDPGLAAASGRVQVVIQLSEPSVAEVAAGAAAAAAQQAQVDVVQSQQDAVAAAASGLDAGARVLGRTQRAVNAMLVEVDAAALDALAARPDVLRIRPHRIYHRYLPFVVDYVGAAAVHAAGYDGSGVRVAVLDTGIDYTHAALGGPGTVEAFEAAYGVGPEDPANTTRDGLFPTDKVVDGIDFVGEFWPGTDEEPADLAPDEDPIDIGGHGTHVADIIGGNLGMAPGVDLLAAKVCSTPSTACSDFAITQGIDWALDPNGDGDLADRVDIINMSLGLDYGVAFDDAISFAVENATALGVLTVAAAGNGADKPYVTGSPAAAPSALSVAQTAVPYAVLPVLEIIQPPSIAGIYQAVFQPWSAPLTERIEAPIQYGDGAGGNTLGCEPFAPGTFDGKIGLVDRGGCNFSLKILHIQEAGGIAGIIGLVAPGEPFEGGFGGDGPITIPGFMISQVDSELIKGALAAGDAVLAALDPTDALPLVGHMVGSSSRGPAADNRIKPEIGAPGASRSAVAGTGDGTEAFGGTSGATPVVSGAAALLRQAYPERSPHEIKSVLMNAAETEIINHPLIFGGRMAPITRIGAGEVRVDRSLAATAAAWDSEDLTGALSFRFHDITRRTTDITRSVTVRNYSDEKATFDVAHTFRFDEDANDAVELIHPAAVSVPANGSAEFKVMVRITAAELDAWPMDSGENGANPLTLTAAEYDGFLTLSPRGGGQGLHLAWQVLPRLSADVTLRPIRGDGTKVVNRSVGPATIDVFSLLGRSDDQPEGGPGENNPMPDLAAVGYATYEVPAGFCSETDPSWVLALAANTHERQSHAVAPAYVSWLLDVDRDGTDDFEVFSYDLSLDSGLTDGRSVSWVYNLETGDASAYFFTEHATNSANTVLMACAEQFGLTGADTPVIDATAQIYDTFANVVTDAIPNLTLTPLHHRYVGVFGSGDVNYRELGPRSLDVLNVVETGEGLENTELGLLLLYGPGAPEDQEAGVVLAED